MSYEKQTWANGDVITATGLNHMEDGIAGAGGGIFLIGTTWDSPSDKYVTDKTWQEIYNAYNSGKTCIIDKSHSYEYSGSVITITAKVVVTGVYYEEYEYDGETTINVCKICVSPTEINPEAWYADNGTGDSYAKNNYCSITYGD